MTEPNDKESYEPLRTGIQKDKKIDFYILKVDLYLAFRQPPCDLFMFEQCLLVHFIITRESAVCRVIGRKNQGRRSISGLSTKVLKLSPFVSTDKSFSTSHLLRGPQESLPLTQHIIISLWPRQNC